MFRMEFTFAVSIITVIALPLTQIPVMAMEGGTEAFGSVMLPTIEEEETTTDDEQKDTGIKSDDSTGTENSDSSDAIKENAETSDTDSDKTTDE